MAVKLYDGGIVVAKHQESATEPPIIFSHHWQGRKCYLAIKQVVLLESMCLGLRRAYPQNGVHGEEPMRAEDIDIDLGLKNPSRNERLRARSSQFLFGQAKAIISKALTGFSVL